MTSTPHRTHRPGPGAAPSRRRSSLLSLMAGLGLPLALSMSMSLSGGPAQAAAGGDATGFPAKPVRLLVGYPPGGVADIMARAIAPIMAEGLKQPVLVDNRAGANGNIAADATAKAAPDGYTLALVTTGIESVNPWLFGKLPFDAQKDLQPVGATGRVLLFLTTRASLAPDNVKDFVALARSSQPRLSFGSAGAGSTPHLVGELLKQSAGFEAVHVPYRGAAPALQDLLASQLDFFMDPGISFANVRAGKLKMLAVASARRSPLFPNVPTLEESGIKGVDYDTWFGLYAPAGTPPEVVARLNQELNKALSQPSVQERFRELGGEATPGTPAEFKATAQREMKVFPGLIKGLGIKAE